MQLRDTLLEGIDIDEKALIQDLAEDLLDRINAIIEGLEYVSQAQTEEEIDHNLRHYQFWQSVGYKLAEQGMREPHLSAAFEQWKAEGKATYTLPKIKRWRQTAEGIGRQSNVAGALRHYCGIDERLSPLEEDVMRAVFQYDEWIDMQIKDMRR